MNDVQSAIIGLRDKGWSLVSIAEELGVFRTAVDKWVAGDRYPRNVRGIHALLELLQSQTPRRPTIPYRAAARPQQKATAAGAVAQLPIAAAARIAPIQLAPKAPDLQPASFDDLQRLLDETALLITP